MEPRYSRILVRPRPCGFGAREPTSTEIRDVALPTAVVSDAQRVADVEIFHERVRDGGAVNTHVNTLVSTHVFLVAASPRAFSHVFVLGKSASLLSDAKPERFIDDACPIDVRSLAAVNQS